MRLAMFGATGTVGSALLPQALDAGHEIRVLARTPSKIPFAGPRLHVIEGNASDPVAVKETVSTCDAVLTALGGVKDPDSIRFGTGNIMAAMPAAGITRLVVMQGYHLTFPGDPDNVGRKLILPILKLMSSTLIDHSRAMATAVQTSSLDWTVVRAPRVVVGPGTGSYRSGILELGPWSKVTNYDVAHLMLKCLTDNTFLRKAPMIAAS